MLPLSKPDQSHPEPSSLRPVVPSDVTDPADARRQAKVAEERSLRTRELRSRWNAPKRHGLLIPGRDGPRGRTLETLESRLRQGVLIALVGPRGTGKTQMLVELMKRVTALGDSAFYRTTTEFLMPHKASYRGESPSTELDVFKAHGKPALLILDEFTRRMETKWENQVLFELFNHRYADMTDTLRAANLGRSDFETHLGPSIISRLLEGGGITRPPGAKMLEIEEFLPPPSANASRGGSVGQQLRSHGVAPSL